MVVSRSRGLAKAILKWGFTGLASVPRAKASFSRTANVGLGQRRDSELAQTFPLFAEQGRVGETKIKRGFAMSARVDPFLDAGMRGYIVNTARKEFWRVASYIEIDDLIQDGYLCYAKCAKAYPQLSKINNPTNEQKRHFMSLVKTAFANHIHTLASKRTAAPDELLNLTAEETETEALDRLLPAEGEIGSFAMLLANAPAEIKQLIQLLTADVQGFTRTKVGRRSLRETTNEHFCRLLGVDPNTVNMVERVKSYFSMA